LFAQQTAQAQTATISVAGAENDPMLVIVTRYSSGTCDLTCVLVDYSFCQEQTPGCLSGWAEIPNDKWKGNVGTSWTSGSVVTIGAVGGVALLPGDGVYGAAWYCEAWDDSGNCSDEVDIPPSSQDIGWLSLTLTKVPVEATFSNSITYQPGTTTQLELWKFTADSTGNFQDSIGNGANPISTNGTCCLAIETSITKTNAVASQVIGDKLSEPALKRLREIERKQKAAIAARAK
jgi:hypothetical protein